jgi:poly(hydroxyalkanoate) granule-associated protein
MPHGVFDRAERAWFTGLGMLATAQEEGGRFFSALVEKGEELEAAGLTPVGLVRGAATTAFDGAEGVWRRLLAKVEAQLAAVLHRLGVPSRDEVATLTRRIEELTAAIESLKARG